MMREPAVVLDVDEVDRFVERLLSFNNGPDAIGPDNLLEIVRVYQGDFAAAHAAKTLLRKH